MNFNNKLQILLLSILQWLWFRGFRLKLIRKLSPHPTQQPRQTIGSSPLNKKAKDKGTTQKQRNSRKVIFIGALMNMSSRHLLRFFYFSQLDRETLSLPVANSQFYTAAVSSISNMLSPIAQTPVDTEDKDISTIGQESASAPPTAAILRLNSPNTPVFELTEEVRKLLYNSCSDWLEFYFSSHQNVRWDQKPRRRNVYRAPKASLQIRQYRPRWTRLQCLATAITAAILQVSWPSAWLRFYLIKIFFPVTTDSQTSEEDSIPPPLPLKHRDSDNGQHPAEGSKHSSMKAFDGSEDCYQSVVSRPLPITFGSNVVSNTHYEVLEIKRREVIFTSDSKASKKNPPTPPPKPARTSRGSFTPWLNVIQS